MHSLNLPHTFFIFANEKLPVILKIRIIEKEHCGADAPVEGDKVKIRIDVVDDLEDVEIIIRCRNPDAEIRQLEKRISQQIDLRKEICLYQNNQEFFLIVDSILFFETDGDKVFAHTKENSFLARYKLYELEKILPAGFLRISKSAIVNTSQIYSINIQTIPSSRQVIFYDTVKHVFVSRRYYQTLKKKMGARRENLG